jgi:16S rRNA (cytosine967-C5)-methyltransferase
LVVETAPAGLPARAGALSILSGVLRKRRALDAAAAGILASSPMSARDTAFARAIAGETLRRFGQLEALIRDFVPKAPPPHKAGAALEIMIAGACELLFLKVAPHAAVDAANRLAQADPKAVHFKGLINAVLRRVSREGEDMIARQDAALNAPGWLWQRWKQNFGEDAARLLLAAHLTPPPLDLTLKSPDDPCTDIPGAYPLAPARLRLPESSRVEDVPGFASGRWWVQDFAASLPARLLGDVAGKRVIDLCAAPGGKTMQLASLGAQVTAIDSSDERLRRVAENLSRTGLNAELVTSDARDYAGPPAPFVLLDAPCTATGTIRRHPDLPWIKSAADIPVMESLQSELLDAAAGLTAAGGTLVYAVCSLEPEEGVDQAAAFLRRRKDFVHAPIGADDGFDPAFITVRGDLQTLPSYWPEKGGMDGFYAARLTRV